MKISNFTFVGLIAGFLFSLFSGIRYFIAWPDTDKAVVYITIGILIMAVSWLYWKNKELGYTVYGLEEYLANGSK